METRTTDKQPLCTFLVRKPERIRFRYLPAGDQTAAAPTGTFAKTCSTTTPCNAPARLLIAGEPRCAAHQEKAEGAQ